MRKFVNRRFVNVKTTNRFQVEAYKIIYTLYINKAAHITRLSSIKRRKFSTEYFVSIAECRHISVALQMPRLFTMYNAKM